MSPAPRAEWRPTASRETLEKRAQVLRHLRAFFDARGVLEVEVPLLYPAAAPDIHLHSLAVQVRQGAEWRRCWLPTSPEYPLKRLLCAGYGDVYALGKVFRDGDGSRHHLPEFTLLEWYRLGQDLHAIMDETEALVASTLAQFGRQVAFQRWRYDALFQQFAGIEAAYDAPAAVFRAALQQAGIEVAGVADEDTALWRQLVLTEIIEPQLVGMGGVFIWGWPAEEAALAALDEADPRIALRFELYLDGVELANGYQELREASAYAERFARWNEARQAQGLPIMPVDERLLTALAEAGGLPACSGVALGVDRLVMAALSLADIRQTVAFAPCESRQMEMD